MLSAPYANLAVGVAAIRELIEQTLRVRGVSKDAVRALDLALDGLNALWGALEREQEHRDHHESDCADIFEFAPAPCVVTDVNGAVRCANRAAADLLGVSAPDLLRKPLESFFEPQQYALMPGYLMELIAQGSAPRTMNWRAAVRAEGKTIAVDVNVREMGRLRGRISGLCWLLQPLGKARAEAPPQALAASSPGGPPALRQTPR